MTQESPFVDGYRLIDGTTLNNAVANPVWSVSSSAKATAGGSVSNSTKITETITQVTTAVANAGVVLPEALPGVVKIVSNNTSNDIVVFAEGGSSVNGIPGNVGDILQANAASVYVAVQTDVWESLALSSATNGFVKNFATIAALKAVGVENNVTAFVQGYYAKGDGGKNVFVGVTGAAPGTYVDNGGTVILPTGGDGSSAWLYVGPSNYIDVRQFGANPSLPDNATFIQKAFDYLLSVGGGTLFVSGVFRVRSQIVVTSNAQQSFTVKGDGKYLSVFDFSNGAFLGLSFVSTSLVDNLLPKYEVVGVGFITSALNCGTALSVSYANPNNLQFTVFVSDVLFGQNLDRISDSGSGYGYWSRAIYFNNCRNALISNIHGFGEMDVLPRSSIGIHMEGECTSLMITKTRLLEWTTAIVAEGLTEGLYIHNCDIVFGFYGLRHTSTAGSQPQLTITDSHFNTTDIGIWAQNIQQSVIANCLIYASSLYYTSGWPEWTGVLIQGTLGRYNKVIGCTFGKELGRTGDITNGIDFNEGFYYQATGNTFFGWSGNQMSNGIIVRAGVGHVAISEDNQYENVGAKVLNGGQWTIVQPQVQKGTTSAVATGTAITFPQQFEDTPIVTATLSGTANNVSVGISNVTTTGFTIYHNAGAPATFNWIATG